MNTLNERAKINKVCVYYCMKCVATTVLLSVSESRAGQCCLLRQQETLSFTITSQPLVLAAVTAQYLYHSPDNVPPEYTVRDKQKKKDPNF